MDNQIVCQLTWNGSSVKESLNYIVYKQKIPPEKKGGCYYQIKCERLVDFSFLGFNWIFSCFHQTWLLGNYLSSTSLLPCGQMDCLLGGLFRKGSFGGQDRQYQQLWVAHSHCVCVILMILMMSFKMSPCSSKIQQSHAIYGSITTQLADIYCEFP